MGRLVIIDNYKRSYRGKPYLKFLMLTIDFKIWLKNFIKIIIGIYLNLDNIPSQISLSNV